MSLLLVGLPDDVTASTITRLRSQDDEVRVLAPNGPQADAWKAAGAHVALGGFDDADLIERACQNVRTLVFGDSALAPDNGEALVNGGVRAGVGRWVYVSGAPKPGIVSELDSTGHDYVVLATGSKGLLRRGTEPSAVALAVDAADDLAGHPKLELNLKNDSAWSALRLQRPSGR